MSQAHVPRDLRERVTAEAGGRCGYCLTSERIVGIPMEVDHIVPQALGGATEATNLWLACSLCNGHKGARIAGRDPVGGETAAIFNPRKQEWRDHFAWTASGERIVGLTPTGRVTVELLRLNRVVRVRARREWVAVGWHPPE